MAIKSLKTFRHLRIRQPSIDCFKSNLIRTFNKKANCDQLAFFMAESITTLTVAQLTHLVLLPAIRRVEYAL
jgi:hypothetical protein